MVSLWNTERWGWNHLLPAEAHVRSEDEYGGHIEEAPAEGLEDFKLETVDVAHIGCIFELAVGHPEEVDGVGWVEDGHEREECNARNRKVQLASRNCHVQGDLVCALQGHTHMQQGTDCDVLLNNIGFKTESRSIQTHVEVSVTVEVIRTKEDVEIANGMDDDENKEEHG